MHLDLSKIPFSFPGSYYTISLMSAYQDELEGLYIRTLHKDAYRQRVARLVLLHEGKPVPFKEISAPASVSLQSPFGDAIVCFGDENTIQFYGEKVGLRIEFIRGSQVIAYGSQQFDVNCDAQREHVRMTTVQGKAVLDTVWNGDNAEYVAVDYYPDDESHILEGVLELYRDSISWQRRTYSSFAESLAAANERFDRYLALTPDMPERYASSRQLAAYLNWMSLVRPYGHLKRPTMYSSKGGMSGIWSWDHCFHAMAVANIDPVMAWNQWMLVFDHQDVTGALPDSFSESHMIRGYVKPPIHGFALKWLMEHSNWLTAEHLAEAYSPLSRWTEWWFNERDSDEDGIPEYHNGNDSGWDNSTVFYDGIPLESPDLATYLIIQMEVLSDVAARLGKPEESKEWQRRSAELLDNMLAHFTVNGRLHAVRSGSHEVVESKSLLLYLPLLLGSKLPADLRAIMIKELKTEGLFLTPNGLASERLDSKLFEEDGYWRGPIWAPPMFLLSHALSELGEHDFAQQLAIRFCDLVDRSGMAENFHAQSGRPLRDLGIVWTSSIFLLLGGRYLK
ncbi:amylo-alpha-1,6-glucosidase [Paenibacillus sp. YIM B09110]|uniref:amylo-alpha-1,6-glucosidase n=1 Tax=Paenibacillus sp. YIM B09110 TaxID=3126102 RepID=UPI00301D428A